MNKPRLIVIGPLPPPHHGVAVSTSLVLSNPALRTHFDVHHLDTTDRRSLDNVSRWDVTNVLLGIRNAIALAKLLRGRRGLVYLPLSQAAPGFLRDSLFIHLARLSRWTVAVHLRGSDFPTFVDASNRLLRLWIHATMRQVASAAVLGSSLRGVFDGVLPRDRVAVVPNGTPDIAVDGSARDPNTVLFLSNLRRRKGVKEAVAAAMRVLDRHPTARFIFAGAWEGSDFEHAIRAQSEPAGDAIAFIPAVTGEAKTSMLGSSSLFLFPPVQPEGHPRVVLEALAAGLPVITTNRGAIAEAVVDGESGFVLEEPDPEQLAKKILLLLRDDALRARMSRAARARYLAHFSQHDADQRLTEWLRTVVRDEDVGTSR